MGPNRVTPKTREMLIDAEPNAKPEPPSLVPPAGTLALCLLTLGTAVAQSIWGWGRIAQAFGLANSPAGLSSLVFVSDGQAVPGCVTLVTYIFPHVGWWHVLSNTVGLWMFGAIAEPETGSWRFATGYILAGIVGAFCYKLVVPVSIQPIVGASLAIAGLAGAYASWRWLIKAPSPSQRAVARALEAAAVVASVAWLALRAVPEKPNLAASLMYHFLPFLAMWIAVQAWCGVRRINRKADRTSFAK